MYGYVKPQEGELLVREYTRYRAFYCGLCRTMRCRSGLFSPLALRDDFVFLAICRTLCEGEAPERRRRCPLHPLRRRPMAEATPALLYSAAAAAVLAYLKNRDDLRDGGALLRLRAILAHLPARRARRRAALSELEGRLAEPLAELAALEAEGVASVDRAAATSGRILAEVFSAAHGAGYGAELSELGACLGRLLYIMDALEDIQSDRRHSSYNPYLLLYPDGGNALAEDAGASLELELAALAAAAGRLPLDRDEELAEIVKNTVHIGLPARANEILAGLSKGVGA